MTDTTAGRVGEILDRMEERNRLRTLRMERHLIVATFAAVTVALMDPTADTGLEILLGSLLLCLFNRSVVRGTDAQFGHCWGNMFAHLDSIRWPDWLMERLVEACRPVESPARAEIKVRPLDPIN